MTNTTGASKTKQSIFAWSINPDELKYQVEQYNTLGITESYRGNAVLLVLALLAFSAVFTLFGAIPLDGGRFYDASTSGHGNIALMIVWWLILMPYLFKALKIEKERNKLQPTLASKSTESIYCPKCGSKEDKDSSFCTNCGNNITSLNLS